MSEAESFTTGYQGPTRSQSAKEVMDLYDEDIDGEREVHNEVHSGDEDDGDENGNVREIPGNAVGTSTGSGIQMTPSVETGIAIEEVSVCGGTPTPVADTVPPATGQTLWTPSDTLMILERIFHGLDIKDITAHYIVGHLGSGTSTPKTLRIATPMGSSWLEGIYFSSSLDARFQVGYPTSTASPLVFPNTQTPSATVTPPAIVATKAIVIHERGDTGAKRTEMTVLAVVV